MRSIVRTSLCLSAYVLASSAGADDRPLTLEAALARARERGAAFASARFRVEEARARVRAAGAFREAPVVDAARGRRAGGGAADWSIGLAQPLDLARGGRVAAAEAGLRREAAAAEHDGRHLLRAVALAFQRAVAELELLEIARGGAERAAEVSRVAARRRDAGDVADLDVGLARAALARARASAFAAEARVALATGELRSLLAFDEAEPLALAAGLLPAVTEDAAALRAAADERPDVRAAQAAVREAEAEAWAARALARPTIAPEVRYERDDGTNVLWAGVSIGLPLWNRGAAERDAAAARASRLRVEADAAGRAARQEVASAHGAYALRAAAVRAAREAAALADESDALARRSYEEGQIGLPELLVAWRETQDARADGVARRLEEAAAAVELLAAAGRLR